MIIGRFLIFVGIISFVLTLVSNYFDIIAQIENKSKIIELGQLWFHFSPNSLQLAETIVSRYVDPCSALEILNCSGFIWHPFISSILLLPAAPVLAFISFLLIAFGIKRSGKRRVNNRVIK